MARRSSRHRRWGPPLAAVAMTAWLVALLGSGRFVDRTAEADRSVRHLLRSLTRHPTWATDQLPDDLELALAAKLVVLLVSVAVLSWLAAGAGSRLTAFLAGWMAAVVSSALAGLVFVAVGNLLRPEVSANNVVAAVAEMNRGAAFGLYTGWLVGMAIAAVPLCRPMVPRAPRARGRRRRTAAPAIPEPPGAGIPPPPPPPAPLVTWPPRPPIGTVLPNPAWTAAGQGRPSDRVERQPS